MAFLARSASFDWGWYLGEATDPPSSSPPGAPPLAEAIAVQGAATPAGGTFGLAGNNSGAAALLNDSNRVLFIADILGLNAVGLFSWTSGGGAKSVVNTRDALPDGANTVLRAGPPSISDTEILMRVFKAGGRATWYAKRLEAGMLGLRKIVAEFDYVPGAGTVASAGGLSMNAKGEVVFVAALLGSDFYPRLGILGSVPATGLEAAILAGRDAPGGGTFTSFGLPQLNNGTQVAFFANTTAGQGIFIATKDASTLAVARAGDPWPGGGIFTGFANSLMLNDSGQVAFRGNKSGGSGLFVGTGDGAPQPVALTGQVLSGIGTINSVPGWNWRLNASGQVAFFSNLSTGQGIFLGSTSGEPQVVARNGDVAPGPEGRRSASSARTALTSMLMARLPFGPG